MSVANGTISLQALAAKAQLMERPTSEGVECEQWRASAERSTSTPDGGGQAEDWAPFGAMSR